MPAKGISVNSADWGVCGRGQRCYQDAPGLSGYCGDWRLAGVTMKVVVALFCALAAVTATPLFGTEQCANGPGVWCVNIRTAKQCSAVTHCQQTVWNKPVINSAPCDICKEVITVVGNFLKDNLTQSEILGLLNKGCDILHDPSMVSECKQLVSDYYPLVINIIEQELSNPSVACCALGLCKSLQQYLANLKPVQLATNEIPGVDLSKLVSPFMANIPLLYPKAEDGAKAENKDICQDCLQLVGDIQDSLKTNSSFAKMLIENYLKECDELGGGLSEMCKTYINQYGELALQMMIQMPAKDLCCAAGLCSQKASPLQDLIPAKVIVPAMKLQPAIKMEPKTPEDHLPICELCEMVVENVEKFLDDNRTRVNIKSALEKVCGILPSQYRSKCKDFVDTYSDLIITLMEEEGNPKLICMLMGCCSARAPQIVKLDSAKMKSGNCGMCKMIMAYLDKVLGQNATQQKIEETLEKICNFLPPSVYDECYAVIGAYGPMIMDLLVKEMDPGLVCVEIGLCPGVKKPLLGTEKCMWGPSYWCKDLETAGSCNAIEHCKHHVWN
ncbi:PREDICTED: prosaposin [Nanorana parkeri]|uniref:prosaposin n=1 Tax=Nanorana parkeri TaxID=125878 RepID=UPI00085433A7|nr:PREDICTED: prosaposin [Nanorana parkeri]